MFGALVGMSPDLDIAANAIGPMAEWIWHRGPTHALWFGPVVGAVVGWLLSLWQGGRRRDWMGLAAVALFTHPLLDIFTTYGTQLLAPFSRLRFAYDAVAIIDPLYSLMLAAAVVVGWRVGPGDARGRRAAWTALATSTAYLLLGLGVNARAETIARRQLASEGVVVTQLRAYPTMFQLPFRRVVARSGNEVRVGWLSVPGSRTIAWESFSAASGPLVEAARATGEVRLFEWFTMGEATPRLLPRPGGGAVVEFDDLRFGLPGRPRDGLWGVRVVLDAEGRPEGPGVRFERPFTPFARDRAGLR